MCTPSRAAIFSGQPPQVNGVFDQLEAGYVPSLRRDRSNMGSMMKTFGYRTAFYGKWEIWERSVVEPDLFRPDPCRPWQGACRKSAGFPAINAQKPRRQTW